MGPLYDGLVHFVTSPDDWAPALALALWAGMRGPAPGRRALFTLPAAWLLGGLVGTLSTPTGGSALFSSLWFVLLGGLLAFDAKLPAAAVSLLAAAAGLDHGYRNGAGLGPSATAFAAVLGIAAAVFAGVALAAALAARLRLPWMRIGLRVAGSWIAAIGLLLLAWALRSG